MRIRTCTHVYAVPELGATRGILTADLRAAGSCVCVLYARFLHALCVYAPGTEYFSMSY